MTRSTRSAVCARKAFVTRAAYSARLWFSWIHLIAVVVYVAALFAEGGSMQMIASRAGEWARRRTCLSMAEVYLAMLVPTFAAGILAPEQGAGAMELAATYRGGLTRLFSERLFIAATGLAIPASFTVVWAAWASRGALGVAELVRSIVPTMWFLTGVTSLGAVSGGAFAGFTVGFGWWALDRLSCGVVTGPLFLFAATFGLRRAPEWLTPHRQKLLLLALGTAMLLVCRQMAGTQVAWDHKHE